MRSDSELQHDVLEKLEWEPSITATQIGVSVKNGVVTLNVCLLSRVARGKLPRHDRSS